MRKNMILLGIMVLCLIFLWECSKSDDTGTAEKAAEKTPAEKTPAESPYLFKLDGSLEDWQDIEPLWLEGGGAGPGAFESSLDIRRVYFKNDNQYLYVFIECSPTIAERFKISPSGDVLGSLYLDLDQDNTTGSNYAVPIEADKFKGYEFRVYLPVGIYKPYDSDSNIPTISYEIQKFEGEHFSMMAVFEQDSYEEKDLIAHGPNGVEFALPLNRMGIELPAAIRVLLAENRSFMKEEDYNISVLTLEAGGN